jgi:apolipoprotein D and lipocalin family protein
MNGGRFAERAGALLRGGGPRGAAVALLFALCAPSGAQPERAPLQALPSLHVPSYMGTWYQVALYPNRFQKQCVGDTTATYRRVEAGIEVVNRCRKADGTFDAAKGFARPAGSNLVGDTLTPARLEVSFLPRMLRWLPIWGAYWLVMQADDGRFAVVSEPRREYLWVLSRAAALTPADELAIRSRLGELGFDLARWQAHPHSAAPPVPTPAPNPDPQPLSTPAAASR